jgi:hypothetical protein
VPDIDFFSSYSIQLLYSYSFYLQQKYYIIGRDKKKTFWRVLKIDRMECSELNIIEDSTIYSENECSDLLKRLDEGNKITGGLKLVATCYGVVGMLYLQSFVNMHTHTHTHTFIFFFFYHLGSHGLFF